MEHIPLPKAPKKCVFRLVPNSSVHVSKHNNSSEIFDLEGAYWEFEIELANVPESEALELDAFLTKLRGQVGKFLMHDYRREQLDLNIPARVDGANQDGNILNIFQLPVNRVYAKAGMYVQIATGESAELKKLTADVVVDSYGKATIEFESPLRRIPNHFDEVVFQQPAGVFRLKDNKQGLADAELKNGLVTSWKIKGREAF